ncbi:MAG: hypothetical protein ACTS4U_00515 [Candidatus Hodgkinia cicadicola]
MRNLFQTAFFKLNFHRKLPPGLVNQRLKRVLQISNNLSTQLKR